ncbi:hypothetical protein [Cohaesibacter haloalkalitolerans]|uniref:hypothetical protein n=1 Tax=Cohaesibacter haloalkalitolerans TaxID=1162980 RepID=UPI0013C51369|nr:hypothetical protein [Cohaesibacter haloalkalitolerans]
MLKMPSRSISAILLSMALNLPLLAASMAASGVTIDGVVPEPDFSAASQGAPYTTEDGPITSMGTVDGYPVGSQNGLTISTTTPQGPEIYRDLNLLPEPVWRMVNALQTGCQAGNLEALRGAIEMNEMPPSFGPDASDLPDPIARLRSLSDHEDNKDQDICDALEKILASGFVLADFEGPYEMFVWPYFAHYPLAALNDQQRVELTQIVPEKGYADLLRTGYYTYFQLGISPNGVWQYFFKEQ